MTEEERQRLQAELLRKQQEQIAMLSQSAMSPEQLAQLTEQAGYDPAGKEAMLATMLRGGQDAVFGDMPQGKQVGDIYVAPTWSESLNAAVSKGLGGYQMGQARKEQTAIDEKRGLSKAAAAQVAAEEARAKQQATAESDLNAMLNAQGDDARAERQITQQAENARLSREAADARLTRTLAARASAPSAANTPKRSNSQPVQYQLKDGSKVWGTMVDGQPVDATTGQPISLEGASRVMEKTEYQRDKDLEKFGARTEKARTLAERVENLDTILQPYVEQGLKPDQIPGIGALEKTEGVVGNVARFASDLTADGAPAGEVNSAVRGVMNIITRNQAGMSQTIAEIERLTGESATKLLNDPQTFLEYYDRLKDSIAADLRHVAQTTPPEAVEAYKANLAEGEFDVSNPQFRRFEFGGQKPPTQKALSDYTDEELEALSDEELQRLIGG